MNRSTLVSTSLFLLAIYADLLGLSNGVSSFGRKRLSTPMHKVQLTQRGYIQFLRWELPVPEIQEFTFCLWLRSDNLTYSHPIFSYSKDERDRLIRAWVSPGGGTVNLEIGGREIFAAPTNIREDRWYHVCQSWENRDGRYAMWIDGQVRVQGRSEETTGHVVQSGGDIVVGQEYTDFDKGLEDGIEGAVLGFNLLLASSFTPLGRNYKEAVPEALPQPSVSSYTRGPFLARVPLRIVQRDTTDRRSTMIPYELLRVFENPSSPGHEYRIRSIRIHRAKRTSSYDPPSGHGGEILRTVPILRGVYHLRSNELDLSRMEEDPLGLQLVKLSYVHCEIGRGSPFIGGPLMLISWSRTPVRVFGGATVKNVRNDCGNF